MTPTASAWSARPARHRRVCACVSGFVVLLGLVVPSLALARFPSPTLSDRLKLLMASRCESLGVPGFAMTVVEHGKVIFQGGYGYADPSVSQKASPTTAFRIPRLLPALTALALLRLQDQRRLFMVNPIGFYLDDVPAPVAATPLPELLNQAARPGLARPALPAARAASHAARPPDPPPRSSQGLLEQLIAQVTGKRFQDYLRDTFFDPLGMSKTGTPDELASAGIHVARSFEATPGRAAGWVQELAAPPPANSVAPLVLASSVEELKPLAQALLDRQFINTGDYRALWYERPAATRPQKNGWALGWYANAAADFNSQHLVSTAGDDSSAGSAIWLLPERDAYVIALANIDTPGVSDIGRSAARMVFGPVENRGWTQGFEVRPVGSRAAVLIAGGG